MDTALEPDVERAQVALLKTLTDNIHIHNVRLYSPVLFTPERVIWTSVAEKGDWYST